MGTNSVNWTAAKSPQNNHRTFTALYDDFPKELVGSKAWAYASIFRHCMMYKGKCTASQATLAKEARISLSTLRRAQIYLVKNGFIVDQTPERDGACHILSISEEEDDWVDEFGVESNSDDKEGMASDFEDDFSSEFEEDY